MTYNSRLLASLVAFFTLVMSVSAQAQVTEVRASVDKNPIMQDEAVQLIITAQGSPSSNQIDLSALEQDFRLSSTSVSQSTRSINFQTTKTTTWVTQLFPRSTGQFTIPPIAIDGRSSKAIELLVMPVGSGQGAAPRDFFITGEVDFEEVYLQQQIKYTTKLYMRQNIQRGSIQGPELKDAIIKQIGEDKEYEDLKNGVRYRVIERVFAIIPQQSGAFSISGAVFQGEAVTDSRQSFGFISRTKPINRVAPNVPLIVLPIPENYPVHWLPSEFVEINEEWQKEPDEFVVGEPITRTITLTAAGLVEEQLPEIKSIYPPDFKTYPDQAKTVTVDRSGLLLAQKVQSEAIIPNRPGTFVIGETKVPWFNVVTKQTEYAVLPARSVIVRLPEGGSAQNTQAISKENLKPNSDISESETRATNIHSAETGLDWLHISLFLLWLATVVVFSLVVLRTKTSLQAPTTVKKSAINTTEKTQWLFLQKAIAASNPQQTNHALKGWLTHINATEVYSVNQTLEKLGADNAITAFNDWMRGAYGKQQSAHSNVADAKRLTEALQELRSDWLEKQKQQESSLSLYPNSK